MLRRSPFRFVASNDFDRIKRRNFPPSKKPTFEQPIPIVAHVTGAIHHLLRGNLVSSQEFCHPEALFARLIRRKFTVT